MQKNNAHGRVACPHREAIYSFPNQIRLKKSPNMPTSFQIKETTENIPYSHQKTTAQFEIEPLNKKRDVFCLV